MSEVRSKNIPKHIPKENVYMTAIGWFMFLMHVFWVLYTY